VQTLDALHASTSVSADQQEAHATSKTGRTTQLTAHQKAAEGNPNGLRS